MNRESRREEECMSIQGRLCASQYDVSEVYDECPSWDTMSTEERLRALQKMEADRTTKTHNLPLDSLLEYIAEGLRPKGGGDYAVTHLAVGEGTSTPNGNNIRLNDEVYRTAVGTAEVDGTELLTSTLFSQTEANGYTISEIGLAGSGEQGQEVLTHALLDVGDEVEKNSGMVLVVDYVLQITR